LGLGKKDIIKNISTKALFSSKTSSTFLKVFIKIIKDNKEKKVKLSNFGTYYLHKSPKRLGRNPKTKEEFEIKATKKLKFKASSKVKSILN
jgi:DNA-binding protein HU-beta